MCTFDELYRKRDSIIDTISDLEEEMYNHLYYSKEMDNIFDQLERYETMLHNINCKIIERETWCINHSTITKEETYDDWYKGEDSNQIKFSIEG